MVGSATAVAAMSVWGKSDGCIASCTDPSELLDGVVVVDDAFACGAMTRD